MHLEGENSPTDEDSLWRRRSVPENEAPVSVAFDAMLAGNEDAAVFLSGLRVYRNGVRFTIEARTRTRLFEGGDLHSALHDHGPTALHSASNWPTEGTALISVVGLPIPQGRHSSHKAAEAATAAQT